MKKNIYTYIYTRIYKTESLCCTAEINNIVNQIYFNKIIFLQNRGTKKG